jgi:hypothetical protein
MTKGGITERRINARASPRTLLVLFIVSPLRSSEDEIANTINRVRQSIAGAGGEMTDVISPRLGDAANCYPFASMPKVRPAAVHSTRAFMLCHFNWLQHASGQRALKLNDPVLRYLLTFVDPRTMAEAKAAALGRAGAADSSSR